MVFDKKSRKRGILMSSSILFPGSTTIKLPEDLTLLKQLQKKRQIYEERMGLYPPESPKWPDALCKKRLLDKLFEGGAVHLEWYAATITDELCRVMPVEVDGVTDLIARAWLIIGDYCQTGGRNADKPLPSPD